MLNCGVVLDFPPMGYFDKENKPAGFDVDYCNDLAGALGVKAEILNLTWGDRIPSLVSGKTDVVVGSTSDTLERAKSVGFSYPYFVFKFQVFSKKGTGINTFDDLKKFKVGAALGTTYETEYLAYAKNMAGALTTTPHSNPKMMPISVSFRERSAPSSPPTQISRQNFRRRSSRIMSRTFVPDYDDVVGLIAKRSEVAWIDYLNLFLIHQIRDGKMNERYNKHFGSEVPADLIKTLRDNK